MTNANRINKMASNEKPNSKKTSPKRVLKRGGKGNQDDDSSVDSKGNIRNLIDYDYASEDESYYTDSTIVKKEYVRKQRRSAIRAMKKISNIMKKENKELKSGSEKRNVTASKRKFPFKKHPKQSLSKRISVSSSDTSKGCGRRELKKNEYETENSGDSASSDADTNDNKYVKKKSQRSNNMNKKEKAEEEKDEDVTEEEESEEGDEEEDNEDEEESEEEEDSEDEEESEDEDEEGDNEEEEYDETENTSEENRDTRIGGILLTLGGSPPGRDNMSPTKYNMKKEPEIVKKFVKLLTTPVEENSIDTQIDQFKALPDEKQKELIVALENRPTAANSGINLMLKILTLKVSPDVQAMILAKYNSLQNLETSSNEYFKLRLWLDKVVSIPFGLYKDIPVRLEDGGEKCSDFMKTAKKYLDDAVYGQDESKLQIMQFISTKIANPEHRGLSLLLVGAPGIGKTTIIKNGIAKALGWPFQFISLGGDSDASTYTGHQLVYESSHCGKIVNSLIASKSMSTVLMFDEIDKISQTPKGEEVMNLLIHLTDPVQNADFEDKYLSGVPIDLSKVMFVFSANDINKIDKVLLDRMMVIDLKGYDLKQKTSIAEQYLLPTALKEVNLSEKVAISKDILTNIIEDYAGDEKGVRELKRCIEQVTQKINMLRIYNSPDLPFHIKDFSLPFIVKKDHVKLFIKKKENKDAPPQGMYM